MRRLFTAVPFVLALLLSGCVTQSLQPLFTPKDVAFEPALNGIWVQKDENEQLVFSSWKDQTGYSVTYTKEGKFPAGFDVHLVQFGNCRFLDALPAEPEMKNELFAMHFVRAHSFHRIWLEGDRLRISSLDPEWLQKTMCQNGPDLGCAIVDDMVVLTAPTASLQALVMQHADDPSAFPEPSEWRRKN